MSLVDRIESDRSDPRLAGELEALRVAWRSLSRDERAAAADAARALADVQARAMPKPAPLDDDAAAQLALRGLDRIDARCSA